MPYVIVVEEISCDHCGYRDVPGKFPDIETHGITEADFDCLPEESKKVLKKFGWNILEPFDRQLLHGSLIICPVCGGRDNFDFDPDCKIQQGCPKLELVS